MLICPLKVSKGKKILTTEKRENSRFLLLFDDKKLFNEYKKKNKSVKKLENDLDYFKKLINKNKKIQGILIRKTPKDTRGFRRLLGSFSLVFIGNSPLESECW